MADTGPVASGSTFDAGQDWRDQRAAYLAEFIAGLATTNPHQNDMSLPRPLLEDGGLGGGFAS